MNRFNLAGKFNSFSKLFPILAMDATMASPLPVWKTMGWIHVVPVIRAAMRVPWVKRAEVVPQTAELCESSKSVRFTMNFLEPLGHDQHIFQQSYKPNDSIWYQLSSSQDESPARFHTTVSSEYKAREERIWERQCFAEIPVKQNHAACYCFDVFWRNTPKTTEIISFRNCDPLFNWTGFRQFWRHMVPVSFCFHISILIR